MGQKVLIVSVQKDSAHMACVIFSHSSENKEVFSHMSSEYSNFSTFPIPVLTIN